MAEVDSKNNWRQNILNELRVRNQHNTNTFAALIQSHGKLLESSESYRLANNRLSVEVERLRNEIADLRANGARGGSVSGGGAVGGGDTTSEELKQKLSRLNDELMDSMRKSNENALQIIDLKNLLSEKEKLLTTREAKISDLEEMVKQLEKKCSNAEQNFVDISTANQVLLDESQALQMAFSAMEQKTRALEEENRQLLSRWMEQKARDAAEMNAEHEQFARHKQEKLRKELEKAAEEPVDVPDVSGLSVPPVAFSVCVPNRAVQTFEAHDGEVLAVRWSPSGRFFATGGSDRKLKLWEASIGKCENKTTLIGSNAGITSVDFDTDESIVMASSNDFASRVWSVSNGRLMQTLTGHSAKVLAAKFIGDSNKVISGSHDRTIKLWDLRSYACTRTIFAGSSCNDIAVLDGNNVVSAHFDKKVRFWDIRSDSSAQKEVELDGKVTSLDISSDKRMLLGCTRSDNIALIELRTAARTSTLCADGFRVATDWTRAAFSPDGSYVAAGSQDLGVYVWDVTKGSLSTSLQGHKDSVLTCAWHPNGQALLTCDKHKTVVYWTAF